MGLYKRCKDKKKNDCDHDWWGQVMHNGVNHRCNLVDWSKALFLAEQRNGKTIITGKQKAELAFERMRAAVIAGTFSPLGERPPKVKDERITFRALATRYEAEYLDFNKIVDEGPRVRRMAAHFGDRFLAAIDTQDIRAYIVELRKPMTFSNYKRTKARTVATINRYIARLSHMWNWAISEELIETTPFRRGEKVLISVQHEDNMITRRLDEEEEDRLLSEAAPYLQRLIITALETGLRRGEMLALTFADLNETPGWITVRGSRHGKKATKSGRTRLVPIATQRLADLFAALRLDSTGTPKPLSAPLFSNDAGEPIGAFVTAFRAACRRAALTQHLRWHDLRHEYASRLVEKGMPLSQVQVVLGHASILTTMRYDNQKTKVIAESAKVLEAFVRPFDTELAREAKKKRAALRLVSKAS